MEEVAAIASAGGWTGIWDTLQHKLQNLEKLQKGATETVRWTRVDSLVVWWSTQSRYGRVSRCFVTCLPCVPRGNVQKQPGGS